LNAISRQNGSVRIPTCILLAFGLIAGAAAAQVPVQTPFGALVQDAAEYARTFNVAPEEAMRRLVAQQSSVAATDALAKGYADRLAGMVIEHDATYRITILLTGAEPVPDRTINAGGMIVPVTFRTGALASRRQIVAAIEAHQADIRAALSGPPGMGVDARTGSLVIMVRPSDAEKEGAQVLAQKFAAMTGVPVEIRTYNGVDKNLSGEGGGRLIGVSAESGKRSLCTAGFVVTDGSRTALSTAAHCADGLSSIESDKSEVPLTMLGAWGARYQDVQINIGPQPMTPYFLVDKKRTMARPVASWRNRDSTRVGDFVCHRGERTGYSCATVEFVDYAPPGDLCAGPCTPTWVAVRGPDCGKGDSGGPVFSGMIAFGLMKGASNSSDGTCRLYYYMSIDYLPPGWRLDYDRQPYATASASIPTVGAASPEAPH
jgi:streptogrisin C